MIDFAVVAISLTPMATERLPFGLVTIAACLGGCIELMRFDELDPDLARRQIRPGFDDFCAASGSWIVNRQPGILSKINM